MKVLGVIYAVLFIGLGIATLISASLDVFSPATSWLYAAVSGMAIIGIGAALIATVMD